MKSLLRPLVAMTVGFSSALVVTAAPAQPTGVQSIVRDGQKDFDWELGTWTTKVRVRTNPLSGEAPTWVEFQGTSVIKVGAKSEGLLDYIAYPAFDCRIEQQGALQSFTKLTGSQRHVGLVFPDSPLRQVFLGTLVLGDEARAMEYGRDPDRDVAGWVARIDDNRWRLILPYPRYESTIDVVELVPAP